MKDIKVLGVDLAKDVFQLHGTDAKGNRVLTKRLTRGKLIEYMANITPCLVGIEACCLDRFVARTAIGSGGVSIIFTIGLIPDYHNPRFNKPPFSSRTVGFPESGWRP